MIMREGASVRQRSEMLSQLERNQNLLNQYRSSKLRNTLAVAKSCAFYSNSTSANLLEEFPLLTKQDVVRNLDGIINNKTKGKRFWGGTSGTTGLSLRMPQTLESIKNETAFLFRFRKWAGYDYGDRRVWLRGDKVVPLRQQKPPYWRYSVFDKTLMFSAFHLSKSTAGQYLDAMVRFRTQVIQANPSVILELARYLESTDSYYPEGLKCIITSSENLSLDNKDLLEKRFQCKVFDWYGLFERVAAIATCEFGRYHLLQDYGHVELIPDEEGRLEIVGTGFNNDLFPLVRYKTGDFVTLSEEEICPCGRVYPIIKSIEGRLGDYLMSVDGRKVHFLSHFTKGVVGVKACQYLQKESKLVTVLVIKDDRFGPDEEHKLVANLKEKLGAEMNVLLEFVDELPRTKGGKVRQAICEVECAG